MKIREIRARKIVNSRGNWAIEVELETEAGISRASVPAGKSRGKHEAVQFNADKSLKIFPEFKSKVIGKEFENFREFDKYLKEISGEKCSKFGVDLVLASSIAFFRSFGKPWQVLNYKHGFPTPMLNIINGGKHAGNELAVQEFMIVPLGFKKFKEKMEAAVSIYAELRNLLEKRFGKNAINVGDEGGFAPPLKKTEEAIEILRKAIEKTGFEKEVRISLDMAANSFFDHGFYAIDGMKLDREAYIEYVIEIAEDLYSVEDPLQEEDWEGFAEVTEKSKAIVVGDDLLVTDPERVKKAIAKKACNAVLVKPNQIGTVSDTLAVIEIAKKAGWKYIISHRSGETNDTFIAELAYAVGAPLLKAGAPARGERVSKYNQLLRMEEMVNEA